MAFSPTSEESAPTIAGVEKCYLWTFTTAEASSGSEVELTGAPKFGRIVRVQQTRTSGTAANHQPSIATVTAGSGVTLPYQATSVVVATAIDDPGASNQPIPYAIPSGESLFYKPGADAGADNVFVVQVLVVEGLS